MKFITFILTLFISLSLHAQRQYAIEIQSDNTCRQIETELIDSITFVKEGDVYIQKTWCSNTAIDNFVVPSNTSVKIQEAQSEYRILENDIDGKDAMISQSGDFCSIIKTNSRNKDICAVFGNKIDSISDYVIMDSLGLIKSMVMNDSIYHFYYGKDSIAVVYNNNCLCNMAYDNFVVGKTRASFLTRNPIYRLLSAISQIQSFINKPLRYSIIRLLHLQMKGNRTDRIDDFTNDLVDGIDLLRLIQLLDELDEYNHFGNASIETLPPIKIGMCNYNLQCKFTKSSITTSFMKTFRSPNTSYKLTMRLVDDKILGGTLTKNQSIDPNESGIYTFNFSNLDIGTNYSYEPDLEIDYKSNIPDDIFMSIYGKEVAMSVHKYGNVEHFSIGNIGCSIGDPKNVKDKSVDLECTYSNVPEGAICGIKVVDTTTEEIIKISNGTTDGTRTVKATGLKPNTDYVYTGFVTYKGVDYPSWNGGGFTTLPPDISGAWNCTEEWYYAWDKRYENPQYKTYSIVLNENGTITKDGKSDYVNSSWSYTKDGHLKIAVTEIATNSYYGGFDLSCTADNANDPKKFTGAYNNWSYNDVVGYVGRGGNSVILSR